MTGNAEIAGNIRIEILYSEGAVNNWLQNNGDVEVVDIKLSTSPYDVEEVQETIMIVYRKES